jgi:hypothetical protein
MSPRGRIAAGQRHGEHSRDRPRTRTLLDRLHRLRRQPIRVAPTRATAAVLLDANCAGIIPAMTHFISPRRRRGGTPRAPYRLPKGWLPLVRLTSPSCAATQLGLQPPAYTLRSVGDTSSQRRRDSPRVRSRALPCAGLYRVCVLLTSKNLTTPGWYHVRRPRCHQQPQTTMSAHPGPATCCCRATR